MIVAGTELWTESVMVRMLITVTVILSVSRAEAADSGNLARRRGHGLSAIGISPPKGFTYRASPRSATWKEEKRRNRLFICGAKLRDELGIRCETDRMSEDHGDQGSDGRVNCVESRSGELSRENVVSSR